VTSPAAKFDSQVDLFDKSFPPERYTEGENLKGKKGGKERAKKLSYFTLQSGKSIFLFPPNIFNFKNRLLM
jgi:hypothetical protein